MACAVLLGGALAVLAATGAWLLLAPASAAVAKLQVMAAPESLEPGNLAPVPFGSRLQKVAAAVVSRPVIRAALMRDEVRRLGLEGSEIDLIRMIENDLVVDCKEPSGLVTLTLRHRDPVTAATVVDAVKNVYLIDVVNAERGERERRAADLDRVLRTKLAALKRQKEAFEKAFVNQGGKDPGNWREQQAEAIAALRNAKQQQTQVSVSLVEALASLEVFDALLEALRSRSGAGAGKEDAQVLVRAVESDQQAVGLRTQLTRLEEEIAFYRKGGFSEDYISLVLARQKAETIRKQLAAHTEALAAKMRLAFPDAGVVTKDVAAIGERMRKRVAALTALDERLRNDIKKLSAQGEKLLIGVAQYDPPEDEIRRTEKIVADVARQLERERRGTASPVGRQQLPGRRAGEEARHGAGRDNRGNVPDRAAGDMDGPGVRRASPRRLYTAGEVSRGLGARVMGALPVVPEGERRLSAERLRGGWIGRSASARPRTPSAPSC